MRVPFPMAQGPGSQHHSSGYAYRARATGAQADSKLSRRGAAPPKLTRLKVKCARRASAPNPFITHHINTRRVAEYSAHLAQTPHVMTTAWLRPSRRPRLQNTHAATVVHVTPLRARARGFRCGRTQPDLRRPGAAVASSRSLTDSLYGSMNAMSTFFRPLPE